MVRCFSRRTVSRSDRDGWWCEQPGRSSISMPNDATAHCAEVEFSGIPLHVVASETGIRRIDFGRHHGLCASDPEHPVVAQALRQLAEYFAGARTEFELKLE